MPNHFHLSLKINKAPISKIMSSLTTSYAMYFNRTYHHVGPVFQNRFKSILVESDSYFLSLSRYIYLNPLKDGLVENPLHYPYSSVWEILGSEPLKYLDVDIVKLIDDTEMSRKEYKEFILGKTPDDAFGFDNLFEKEESALGSVSFSTRANKAYTRRKKRSR